MNGVTTDRLLYSCPTYLTRRQSRRRSRSVLLRDELVKLSIFGVGNNVVYFDVENSFNGLMQNARVGIPTGF